MIDIDNLNAPDWLKNGLRKLDIDGDGLEKHEVEDVINFMADEKVRAKLDTKELDYTRFPPKIQEVLATWDLDKSGSISVDELMIAAKSQHKMAKQVGVGGGSTFFVGEEEKRRNGKILVCKTVRELFCTHIMMITAQRRILPEVNW